MQSGKSNKSSPTAGRGFTLIEATIAIVIVSVMLVTSLHTFGSLARGRQIVAERYSAAGLASQLISEIVLNSYDEPNETFAFGPEASETGGTRVNFDDVDDYHGWTASPPQENDGTAISGLTDWQRSVTVQYVSATDPNTASGTDQGLKQITVTVTHPDGPLASMTCLQTSSGRGKTVGPQTDYVKWVGVELQIGPNGRTRVDFGTNLLNRAAAN